MIKVITWDRTSFTLQQNLKSGGDEKSPNWYNPFYRCFTNVRMVKLIRTVPQWYVNALIKVTQKLRIYTVVGHEPMLTPADEERIGMRLVSRDLLIQQQRVKDEDGDDYIDEFGRYVYLTSRVGNHPDVDLRYDCTPDPELFTLKYVEHDLPDRQGHRILSAICTG